jgi:hypothetical protein
MVLALEMELNWEGDMGILLKRHTAARALEKALQDMEVPWLGLERMVCILSIHLMISLFRMEVESEQLVWV